MIKIFRRHLLTALNPLKINNKPRFSFSGTVNILRESDELSMTDIDSILGN
jgi:hypothetical protein